MIFNDIWQKRNTRVESYIKDLFQLGLKNQTHDGDMLLISENGFYNSENPHLDGYSRYVFGPGKHGLSEFTHNKFIYQYSNQISKFSFQEYLKQIKPDPKRKSEIEKFIKIEEISVQIEMLIYLKFWEADIILKKLYQLVNMIHKNSYDWHFKLTDSARDNNSTGKRHEIVINSIRNRMEKINIDFYNSIKDAYLTQIRNAIAHSRYAIAGRDIMLNNYIKSDPASQLHNISFNDWIIKFHETLLIHNGLVNLMKMIQNHYRNIAIKNNNLIEVRITKKDNKTEFLNMQFYPQKKRWGWEQ